MSEKDPATHERRSEKSRHTFLTNFHPERANQDSKKNAIDKLVPERAFRRASGRCDSLAVSKLILLPVFSAGASFRIL